jgi:hypothetical protein
MGDVDAFIEQHKEETRKQPKIRRGNRAAPPFGWPGAGGMADD